MIVLIVDGNCIRSLESKGDSPVATHTHRPDALPLSLQFVQVQSRQIHVVRRSRRVATTQELAEDICYYGKNFLVWCNFEGRVTTAGNLAYPYSPTILNLGVVYRLRIHHLLPIEDPACFPIRLLEVAG